MHSLLSQICSISYSVGLSFGIRDASLVNSRQPRWLALICLRGLLNTDQGNRNAYFIAFNSTVLRRCRHNLSTVQALPRSCQHGMGKKTRIPRLQNLSTSLDAVTTINSVWIDSIQPVHAWERVWVRIFGWHVYSFFVCVVLCHTCRTLLSGYYYYYCKKT